MAKAVENALFMVFIDRQQDRQNMRHKPSGKLFDHPSDMEPLLPEDGEGGLAGTALLLIRKAERLRGLLHPITRKSVAQLVRSMNSYYSNLIEGHRTTPRDIDSALSKDFSSDETQRALQIQHVAHVEAQAEMEARLQASPAAEVCSADFLCWLHGRFYERLPESLRRVEGPKERMYEVLPGAQPDHECFSCGQRQHPF